MNRNNYNNSNTINNNRIRPIPQSEVLPFLPTTTTVPVISLLLPQQLYPQIQVLINNNKYFINNANIAENGMDIYIAMIVRIGRVPIAPLSTTMGNGVAIMLYPLYPLPLHQQILLLIITTTAIVVTVTPTTFLFTIYYRQLPLLSTTIYTTIPVVATVFRNLISRGAIYHDDSSLLLVLYIFFLSFFPSFFLRLFVFSFQFRFVL